MLGRPRSLVALGVALVAITSCERPIPRQAAKPSPSPSSAPAPVTAPGPAPTPPAPSAADPFAPIDRAIEAAIAAAKMPGCVLVVGRHDEVLLERAYGSREVSPATVPMTVDTVFDLASLTKPVATATSAMLLVERGKLDLDAPVARFVPELGALPPFTVRDLLLHTSGLPAATGLADYEGGRAALMRKIGARKPWRPAPPGSPKPFVYSDVGFMVLEEVVRRVSGKDLATFASAEIFDPIGMTETGFSPAAALAARAAPTEAKNGVFLRGKVHDPRAAALGGTAGHAGLFSTAKDLTRFAQAMLRHGELDGKRFATGPSIDAFTTRHETSKGGRGLGWDVDSTFATHRGSLLSTRAFGHGGFTGTAMWIDPVRDLFVVFLSNRVHPDGTGAVNPLVAELTTLAVSTTAVKTGIDVLVAEDFARLKGANVGVVTNGSARALDGTTTIDALRHAPGVNLRAIFVPEHGLGADREGNIKDGTLGELPVYGLYGERFSPTAATLDGIDTLVFDLQDVGVRFYTYASTMKRAMSIAAQRKLRFVVLDRPNPIDGVHVQGPVLAPGGKSFVNHHALPVRHGMTMGELARLFADEDALGLTLDVVTMTGWQRRSYFDHTSLAWVAPSPNLRSVEEAVLYPAIGLLEGTNLSVGRGTSTPFEVFGAPWLDAEGFVRTVSALAVPGVTVSPTTFVPKSSVYAGKSCRGVAVHVTDRDRYDPVATALTFARVLADRQPEWEVEHLDRLLSSKPAMEALRAKKSVAETEATWAVDLASFEQRRRAFLLYP